MAVFSTRNLLTSTLLAFANKGARRNLDTSINRTTLLLSIEGTFKAISRLVELTQFKNEEQVFTVTKTLV